MATRDVSDMREKIQVDLIMSVGSSCRAARNLQDNSLRYLASPLDWMCCYSLETVLALFQSGFETFFANRERVPGKYYSHQHVRDLDTGMESLHHFPHGADIDAFYESDFKPTMKRRFRALDALLKKSRHVLLLCNRDEDREQVVDFLLRFSRLYACKFTMINIRNIYPENRHAVHVHAVSDRCALIEHCFCDVHPKSGHEFDHSDWWTGNADKWAEVLSGVEYTRMARLRFALRNVKRWVARVGQGISSPQPAAR